MLEYNTMIQYNSYVSKDHGHYKISTQPKCTRDHDKFVETVFRFWGREECNGEHNKKRTDFSVRRG